MPYEIELNNEFANTDFNVIIGEKNIKCLLQTDDNDTLLMSVFVNNQQIGMPFICFANQPVIPFRYMIEKLGGNFIFETVKNEYPNFENFGNSCRLFFNTIEEIKNAE